MLTYILGVILAFNTCICSLEKCDSKICMAWTYASNKGKVLLSGHSHTDRIVNIN